MHLQTLLEFSPQKHALFLHPRTPLLRTHESTDFLAFATRNNEVVLHNTKTGRSTLLLKSQHGIAELAFTRMPIPIQMSTCLWRSIMFTRSWFFR